MSGQGERSTASEMSRSKKHSDTESVREKRSVSPTQSCVSMKSDTSKDWVPPDFREGELPSEQSVTEKRSESPTQSCVSMKSDTSIDGFRPNLGGGELPSEQRKLLKKHSDEHKEAHEDLSSIFSDLEKKVMAFIKRELEWFKRLLKKETTKYYDSEADDNYSAREAALDIALHFLKKMNHTDLADTLESSGCPIEMYQHELKSHLKKNYECVSEGTAVPGDRKLLKNIYTDLFITEGGIGAVNEEHEVRQIEKAAGSPGTQEKLIECNNIFQPLPGQDKPIRTVLTKGVAGVGKSISVQKFIMDWVKGIANQDIELIFPLPFRELNLKNDKYSFMDILHQFFPDTKGLMFTKNKKSKVLFVFDGLDEYRHPLDFQKNEIWSDMTTPTSVDVLLTNLIKGNLLPSALIWITSRPAAASCIPPDCIDQVAEIRGFNDTQKEKYFRKRITDVDLADRVIEHIRHKESRSLYIMCHIPVFCWIAATVLQRILEETAVKEAEEAKDDTEVKEATEETASTDSEQQTLKTLTQMYSHFLIFQTRRKTEKYGDTYDLDTKWDEKSIMALGHLAFQNLLQNNLIFCESDLTACGLTVKDASVYSGMCTQIFQEDSGVFLGTAFCFVHLSIQEFFAALYAHMCIDKQQRNVFDNKDKSSEKESNTVIGLLKNAVNKALESDSGHLDLFLRFLLGLSLESNQKLLHGLLTQADISQSKEEIVRYIKEKFKENTSAERSINLFHCLNELNDKSLVEEIQNHMRSGSLSSAQLSPAQWSALVFVLLTSEEQMEEFDLKKFIRSDECLKRLLPVVKTATKALLDNCNLTQESCSGLATVLSSNSSSLRELDLTNNKIEDSGVQFLATQLNNPQCKLEILRLSDCGITGEGYASLASALKSNPSHLVELDLRGNDPGHSGVKLLSDLQKEPACKLKIRLLKSDAAEKACVHLTSVLGTNPLLLTDLDLSGKNPGDSGVKQFCALLGDSHCKLKTVKLNYCSITEEGCDALTSALRSNPSHLIELNLSGNKLRDSGVKQICLLLENPEGKLQKLLLSDCGVTGEGYATLTSALKSNPSHLMELDLRGNDPGDSGVKLLTDLHHLLHVKKLKTLRLLKSDAAEKACAYLTSVLGTNPLLLTELDLSGKRPGDSGVKQFCALLEDSHCKLKTVKLNNSSITEEGCAALTSALSSNPSHLIELNLSGNELGHSGVKHISALLQNPHCKLQRLLLNDSSITEEGCADLTSALRSNPSHLIELNLSGNTFGDSGVKLISALLQNPHCKLQRLLLNNSSITEEGCAALTSALRSNPSHLIELNLSENTFGDSGVKQISDLLENPHCKLQRLLLSDCSITGEGYAALTSALKSNPSHLVELDLRGNNPGESGVELLTDFYNLLNDQHCKLERLRLLKSDAAEKACAYLTSVLGTNPLLLTELDLSGKKLRDSRVKLICALLGDSHCKLKTLKLNDSSITEEGCADLTSALRSNPSHLIELNLSENKLGDSGVKHISALLENTDCKLQRLLLNDSSITVEGCAALTSALRSNPSHLIELNLSGNKLGDSGVKHISALLGNPHCKLQRLLLYDSSITAEGCADLISALRSNPSHLIELHLKGDNLGYSGVKHISALLEDPNYKLEKLELDSCILAKVTTAAAHVLTYFLGGQQEVKSDSSTQQRKAEVRTEHDQGDQESDTSRGVSTSGADGAHAGQ